MKNQLTPIRFKPVPKTKIWGGHFLASLNGKFFDPSIAIGESWEVSAIPGDVSIVAEGVHKGKPFTELIAEEPENILGVSIAQKYDNQFPLLIKLLDAQEDLSVQVHPNDAQAKHMGLGNGKTEMWHILHAAPGAKLNIGFRENTDARQIERAMHQNALMELLNFVEVKAGDTFFIPAGTVHYIGKGIVLAEIQQSSDTTFRVFDFNRHDADGKLRDLHVPQALEVMHTHAYSQDQLLYNPTVDRDDLLVSCPFFKTYLHKKNTPTAIELSLERSFKIIIGIGGEGHVRHGGETYPISLGDTLFLPACLDEVSIAPQGGTLSWLEIEAS